ncbi:MAG: PPOX class F420-dependent oxidoreductase [Actinomycetota bacterium]|nr:PPOX class F420-dependent oxidoreductase [Actinomycetota bacterium]
MDLPAALAFAEQRHQGVLATIRRDGRPQLSNILYAIDEGFARISVTETRAKTRNLQRDPRASLYVVGENFWSYVVLDGDVELSEVANEPRDATVEQLIALYRRIRGEEHSDWDEYRKVMVEERRLVASLRIERAYGMIGR